MQSKMVLHACLCVAAAHISFCFLYFLRFMVVSLRVGKKKCQKRTSALDDLPRDCTTVFTSLTRFFFFFFLSQWIDTTCMYTLPCVTLALVYVAHATVWVFVHDVINVQCT